MAHSHGSDKKPRGTHHITSHSAPVTFLLPCFSFFFLVSYTFQGSQLLQQICLNRNYLSSLLPLLLFQKLIKSNSLLYIQTKLNTCLKYLQPRSLPSVYFNTKLSHQPILYINLPESKYLYNSGKKFNEYLKNGVSARFL